MCRILLLTATMLSSLLGMQAHAQKVGFIENFALSKNRAAELSSLVPGTEDYYYFHCLHYQNSQQLDKVDDLLKPWVKRFGKTERVEVIRNRQALLNFDKDPEGTYRYLQSALKLRFDHQREIPQAQRDLPSQLDQKLVASSTLLKQALSRSKNTDQIEGTGLEMIAESKLDKTRRRHLLSRLRHPDYRNLIPLIVADLKERDSGGFGSIPIHRMLTLEQLAACRSQIETLETNTNFVQTYLSKLQPSADVDWKADRQAHNAYLKQLAAFADTLPRSFNSLKANILYRQLELNRIEGIYDAALFLEYLKLPRQIGYVNPLLIKQTKERDQLVNLSANYYAQTRLTPILNDQALIEAYLHHFLKDAEDFDDYRPYIREEYLKQQFATIKIMNGIGDVETWASMLTPTQYQQLLKRVDLDFDLNNPEFFADSDKVKIDLHTKNIDKLIVKVFQINTFNFYRKQQQEIDTNISLDGLVPNYEETHEFNEPAALRVKRTFTFEQLTDPGVYIIDFIAGGKSSRALIRRGRLTMIGQPTAVGQQYRVFDHNQQPIDDAQLWISGRKYLANDQGLITVPFTQSPSKQMAIIRRGDLSSMQNITQTNESYTLEASLYVDRENLIRSEKAHVVIRPRLSISGIPTSVGLLKDPQLSIVSTNQDGISSTKVFEDIKLNDQRETSVEFIVPPRLETLVFTLSGSVENISQNQSQALAVSRSFSLNQIDQTEAIQDIYLVPAQDGYWLEVRGKSGELRTQQPVQIRLKHADFKQPVNTNLQSNQVGLIHLGSLAGIESVSAALPGKTQHRWSLPQNRQTAYGSLHMQQGQLVEISAPYDLDQITRDRVSLTEVRGGQFTHDRFSHIQFSDGMIQLVDLPAGDYLLRLKVEGRNINIRIGDGPVRRGIVLGKYRQLEIRDPTPLTIESVTEDAESISVQLQNTNESTRVIALASRYLPGFESFSEFSRISDIEPLRFQPAIRRSVYLAGRQIGDEFQYILDRKYASKYPGNMLDRPSLLLNPWDVRDTNNNVEVLEAGADFGRVGGNIEGSAARSAGAQSDENAASDTANLDFLAQPSLVLWNVKPDKNGVVKLKRKKIGNRQHIRLIALDNHSTVQRSINLPAAATKLKDLRLARAMKPNEHFCQTKQIEPLAAGKTLEINDLVSAKFQIFDDLSDVYRLFLSVNPTTELESFQFILDWNNKTDLQKQELYSKHACHELNFFIYKKDAPFFESVVRPNLQHKRQPQFMDHYLLGHDLSNFLKPWEFSRLNVAERVLLAQRSEGQSADIVRSLNDQYLLTPTTRKQFDKYYDASMAYNGLNESKLNQQAQGLFGETGLPELDDAMEDIPDEEMAKSLPKGALEGGGGGKRAAESLSFGRGRGMGDKPASLNANRWFDADSKRKSQALTADDQKNLGMMRSKLQAMNAELTDLGIEQRINMEKDVTELEALYRRLPATKEWIENNYYRLLPEQQTPELVSTNRFWRDYANHQGGNFLSPYFAESNRTFTEMMLALSILDLPDTAQPSKFEYADDRMTMTAAGPVIALHQQVKPAVIQPGNTSILISENFFLNNDRHRFEDGIQYDKFIEGEFLAHQLYGAQVVITNPTSTPRSVDLLIQVPRGAVTANGSQETRSIPIQLDGFSTETFEYFFYFPTAGEFTHYPAHVSSNENVLAFAQNVIFNVVDRPAELDKTSWQFVSQNGTDDEVIDFLNQKNLLRYDMSRIAFRLKDKSFFDRVISSLKNRYIYNHVLWSYGIQHAEPETTRQYLTQDKIVNQFGAYFKSSLLDVIPTERNWYYHREYSPLVNARTHRVGLDHKILNPQFHDQYIQLMNILAHHSDLSSDDHLVITYYMLLQDRIDEALDHFSRIDQKQIKSQMQYDYCDAYLDLYRELPEQAATKAKKWADYPVDRWRNRFQNILTQVKEIRGGSASVVDNRNTQQIQTELAAKQKSFDFKIESGKIIIDSQNLKQITANFYEIDIELLFSRNPFSQDNLDGFSVIRPNQTSDFKLDPTKPRQQLKLPQELENKNVLIELTAGDQVKSKPYFANSLAVQIIENYGQARVTDAKTGKPLPKTYIKVYAQSHGGEVRFHKDGYTDLRGRFDYVSQSNNPLDNIARYAILVFSEDQGATVRQAAPPAE